MYERMNHIFHNSSIPATANVSRDVNFAYGGIGLIIHARCIIGDFATIGSNVDLGPEGAQIKRFIPLKMEHEWEFRELEIMHMSQQVLRFLEELM